MIYLFLIISIIINLILVWIAYNLYTQISQFESELAERSQQIEKTEQEVINHYTFFLKIFTEAFSEMQRIDNRGSFSSDDEVGFAFRVILSAIENVKEKLLIVTKKDNEQQTTEQ